MVGTVYIVYGWAGEYEDTYQWNVGAFTSELAALALRDKLNGIAKQLYGMDGYSGYFVPTRTKAKKVKDLIKQLEELDPNHSPEYSIKVGKSSYVSEVAHYSVTSTKFWS